MPLAIHIWITANSHASYNRYNLVYKNSGKFLGETIGELVYHDRVDYEPSGNNLYFQYDILINLGEVAQQTFVKCPDSGYTLEFHGYPLGTGSKHWLAYRGKCGDFNHTGSPFMFAKEPGNPSHEWVSFTNSTSFGNTGWYYFVAAMNISWITDDNTGD